MKSFVISLLAIVFLFGIATYAQDKKDAEEMVKKAITYYRSVDKNQALWDFSNPKGKFKKGSLYVTVYDLNGKCLANGGDLKLVGKDQTDLKDADGKEIIKERLSLAKTYGKGWQIYKWKNPLSKEVETKTTYFEKADDVIFACGIYGIH